MTLNNKNYLRKDLCFSNHDLENEFTQSKIKYQHLFLYIVLLFGFLVGILSWAINPFNLPNYEGAPLGYRITLILVLIIGAVIGWKKPQMSEKLIIILILIYFIGLMETSQKNRLQWNNVMYFITGINTQFITAPSILAKISWKATSFLLLIINTLNCFRYSDFDENFKMKFYPLLQLTQNTVLIIISAYLVEKYDRESFYKIKSYEYSLSRFKDLIKNLFPSCVIITRGEKILFNNKEALNLFACESEEDLWKKLGRVKLEQVFDNTRGLNSRNIILTEEKQAINHLTEERSLTLQEASLSYLKELPLKKSVLMNHYGEYEQPGNRKALEIKITEIVWENENALLIIISENLHMQKVKFMKEQSAYKDRLLATVSHDLRTPLSGIIGMLNMALELVLDATVGKYLNLALRSSQMLLLMINDILDYTYLSLGNLKLNTERFSLWSSIKEVAKLFKFQAQMKGISLIKENLVIHGNINAVIKSDKNRIKQILFNLMCNALKFTVHGTIKITLREYQPQVHKNKLGCINYLIFKHCKIKAFEVFVEDTGIGIKRENQTHLFKLFGKLQDEENDSLNKTGIGLGLALSQNLLKILNNNKMEGEIKVESEYKKGSVFSFVIFSDEENILDDSHSYENRITGSHHVHIDIGDHKNKRIYEAPTREKLITVLVVDSDKINITVISSYLKCFSDFIFDLALSGEEGINLIKKRASFSAFYDLIFIDCDPNKVNVFEFADQVKSMIASEEIPEVPMIGCSANASGDFYNKCLKNGIKDHMVKPFSKEMIRAKIEQYCS